ncbi:MAG: transcription antitermination factor NusB [Paracoccaceae bacterium]
MAQPGLAPRLAAVHLLNGVTRDHRLLAQMLPDALARLAPDERARAQRLALGCLRQVDRCDRLLGPHLRKRPDEHALNILRLAVYEICAEGAAPHGVVNAAVAMARAGGRDVAHLAGLVNAVLRKLAETGPAAWAALPPPRLPKWLRKVLVADFGKAAVAAIEAAHAAGAPVDLTPKDGDGAALAAQVGGVVLPSGSVRLAEPGQISALPGYGRGDWWVQDAAAAIPARMLAVQPGERVLDMCAAPGGKTMQMAASGADVTAIDLSGPRMARVQENLARTGLAARIVVGDVLAHDAAPYDAILLDAPCSATGTIRRHPDLPHAKDGSDFPALFALQERMIDHALALLRPGGRLVFCTCSLLIDEGEEQLADALTRHPGLRADRDAALVPGVDPGWVSPQGGLRLRPDYWPDLGGMDGFFAVRLHKPE